MPENGAKRGPSFSKFFSCRPPLLASTLAHASLDCSPRPSVCAGPLPLPASSACLGPCLCRPRQLASRWCERRVAPALALPRTSLLPALAPPRTSLLPAPAPLRTTTTLAPNFLLTSNSSLGSQRHAPDSAAPATFSLLPGQPQDLHPRSSRPRLRLRRPWPRSRRPRPPTASFKLSRIFPALSTVSTSCNISISCLPSPSLPSASTSATSRPPTSASTSRVGLDLPHRPRPPVSDSHS